MSIFQTIIKKCAHLPIDLGQGTIQRTTKGKEIAFTHVTPATQNARVLDIGCGDGYWSDKLKERGYHVTSIDIPRTYPNEDSNTQYPSMIIVDANQPLPFPDASFDLVWCSEVIEHLTNYRTTLAEIRRVLRLGGTFIITTPNSFFWLARIFHIFGLQPKDWQNSGHVNFFHKRDIRKLLPEGQIQGYFPYTLVKLTIGQGVGLLSPTFIVVGQK